MAGQDQTVPADSGMPQAGRMPTTVAYGDPGIGGISVPATQSMDMSDYLKAIQAITKPTSPGATVPYGRQTDPQALHPRMPVPPTMVPMQSTAQQPVTSSLEERRRARARSWGATIGNMIGTVANAKMQEKYQGKVSAIQDYSDAQIEAQKNQKIMNYYKDDPNNPAYQDAKAGLESANQTILNIQKGKNWTDVEKAYKNYEQGKVDPQQMDEDGHAFKEGVGKAIAADSRDTRNDNKANAIDAGQAPPPQQQTTPGGTSGLTQQQTQPPAVGASLQATPFGMGTGMAQQAPSPDQLGRRKLPVTSPATGQPAMPPQATQRAMQERRLGGDPRDPNFKPAIQLPQQMGMNPEYVAQQKYEQAIAQTMLRSVVPAYEREKGAEYKADKDAITKQYVADRKANADIAKANIQAKNRLDQQSMRDATTIHDTQLRVNGLITRAGIVTDPRQAAALGIASMQQQKFMEKDINDSIGQVSKLEGTNTKLRADALLAGNRGEKESQARMEDEIRVNQREMEILNGHIKKMMDQRDNLVEGTAGLPAVSGANPAAGGTDLLGIALNQPGAGGAGAAPTAGAAPMTAADYNPKGGFQQWLPMTEQFRAQYAPNVPPALAQAILINENAKGNPNADPKPGSGGQGLWQLTRTNQRLFGVKNVFDPADNTAGAMRMLADSFNKRGGDIRKVIYDYGPKDGSDPGYVDRVLNTYKQLAATSDTAPVVGAQAGAALSGTGSQGASTTSGTQYEGGIRLGPYRLGGHPVGQAAAPSAAPQAPSAAAPAPAPSQDETEAIKNLVKKLPGM